MTGQNASRQSNLLAGGQLSSMSKNVQPEPAWTQRCIFFCIKAAHDCASHKQVGQLCNDMLGGWSYLAISFIFESIILCACKQETGIRMRVLRSAGAAACDCREVCSSPSALSPPLLTVSAELPASALRAAPQNSQSSER